MTLSHVRRDHIRALAQDLRALGVGQVAEDVDLRAYSRWRCGGAADLIVTPDSAQAAQRLVAHLHKVGAPWAVVSGGSNLFFDDAGVRTPLVHIGAAMSRIAVNGEEVSAEAGAWTPAVAMAALHASLSGVEHIIGVPGGIGGLVLMNGGSLRQSVGDVVQSVDIITADGETRTLSAEQCAFAYRRSALQDVRCIVTAARLRLRPGDKAIMRRKMIEIMADRRRKFPKHLPNCGSVFVSDPALYASVGPPGAVIERCGFKGVRIGGAEVSPRHANFIVNAGGASAQDILDLIARVRAGVYAETGHWMRCEVRFMSQTGETHEAHEWLEPRKPKAPAQAEGVAS